MARRRSGSKQQKGAPVGAMEQRKAARAATAPAEAPTTGRRGLAASALAIAGLALLTIPTALAWEGAYRVKDAVRGVAHLHAGVPESLRLLGLDRSIAAVAPAMAAIIVLVSLRMGTNVARRIAAGHGLPRGLRNWRRAASLAVFAMPLLPAIMCAIGSYRALRLGIGSDLANGYLYGIVDAAWAAALVAAAVSHGRRTHGVLAGRSAPLSPTTDRRAPAPAPRNRQVRRAERSDTRRARRA